ncbi:glycoprotein xg [Willisornis vidua]|uniref:Glycoprotein xg n=1 Tax=Willisornis vidua TaxID=1566151 RepID=A0ABQ9CWJ3_9PASS|nr:glycoprotein xg [Willisornis vidua]
MRSSKVARVPRAPGNGKHWPSSKSKVQDIVLPLDEPPDVPIGPFFQPVGVPLVGSTTLWCISLSSQFGALSKLAEGTLCSII